MHALVLISTIGIRNMMVLYSGTTCPFSQRCRFVLFEKGMDFEIRDIDLYTKPEDIAVMNPYGQVPILVERDLILYESNIINEYIDENTEESRVGKERRRTGRSRWSPYS